MHLKALIGKKQNEQIKYTLRRHWMTFIPKILFFLLLMLIPLAVYVLIYNTTPSVLTGKFLYPSLVLFGSAYYLSIYLFFFAEFLTYYLDEWIITNQRIIDVEQLGLFSRSISETNLSKIQDVTTEIHGVIPTLFNYGNIHIKTASTNPNIIAKNVPKPNKVRTDLIRLASRKRKRT